MEEQITALLAHYVSAEKENTARRPRKQDSLMGIIAGTPEQDYKRIHLQEKYGVWKSFLIPMFSSNTFVHVSRLILTFNTKDYKNSDIERIKVLTPEEFLEMFK